MIQEVGLTGIDVPGTGLLFSLRMNRAWYPEDREWETWYATARCQWASFLFEGHSGLRDGDAPSGDRATLAVRRMWDDIRRLVQLCRDFGNNDIPTEYSQRWNVFLPEGVDEDDYTIQDNLGGGTPEDVVRKVCVLQRFPLPR